AESTRPTIAKTSRGSASRKRNAIRSLLLLRPVARPATGKHPIPPTRHPKPWLNGPWSSPGGCPLRPPQAYGTHWRSVRSLSLVWSVPSRAESTAAVVQRPVAAVGGAPHPASPAPPRPRPPPPPHGPPRPR